MPSAEPPLTQGQWEPWAWPDSYTSLNGPIRLLRTPDNAEERFKIGMWVEEKHCNRFSTCHGAILAGLVDCALGINAAHISGRDEPGPTISMSLDFTRPARLGVWIESESRIVRASRSLVFCEGQIVSHEGPCVRASAIFARPRTA